MKFRCDHCGADSPLDRDSLVLSEGDGVPHITCKLCGKMSVFGGGQLFSGERSPARPASEAPSVSPTTAEARTATAPDASPRRLASIALWGLAVAAILIAVGAMMLASNANTKVNELKWNKADVAALGDQEAEHERHDHQQALVVLGSTGTAQVGTLPIFLSAPTIKREGDGFHVDGMLHNALSVGMSDVEIQFVDATGKEKIGVSKVGTVAAGQSAAWKVFLPGLGLKDERFVSVYAVVEHHLELR